MLWPQSCWVSLGRDECLTSSVGCLLGGRAGLCGETQEGWVLCPPWLPGRHVCFLRRWSSPCNFIHVNESAPHATNHLSTTSGIRLGSAHAWQGNPQLCLSQSGAIHCKVPWYHPPQMQCTWFPLLTLKIHVKPKVKNKNQKQNGWSTLMQNPLALPWAWSYVWQWQLWCREGTHWVSPFVLNSSASSVTACCSYFDLLLCYY